MSALYQRFGFDQERQENGFWFDIGDGIKILIRRWRSQKSVQVLRDVELRMKATLKEDESLTDEQRTKVSIEHIAAGIIADWEGIEVPEKGVIPYSPEAAIQILTDLPEFRDVIARAAFDDANFIDDRYLAAEKN